MNKGNRSGVILIVAGAALIIAALSLFCRNRRDDAGAGEAAASALADVRAAMERPRAPAPGEGAVPDGAPPMDDALPGDAEEEGSPAVYVDGYEYIGCLELPSLGLELPVMADWSYAKLKIAPCRQFGSAKTDDLVIAGHNYKRHFGYLYKLDRGDPVLFTDMEGTEYAYETAAVKTLEPTEVEAVQDSGHDLVLYTCTYGGKTRVAVFCDRQEGLQEGQSGLKD